ncbi:RDD family protein [Oceanobacillus kimchii]|uniref:RDD family protein n=1 Tax=Oceanobacillus kimchii TaxID=746691 RepID=UPI0009847A0D|nr:RDD family protein [Oceanobacillus kimchii]
MKAITKKRTKAYFIDLAISTAVTIGVEQLMRKKIKSEAVHALVTPTVVMWGLEYAQLRRCGQTIGYKQTGLKIEGTDGQAPTPNQIIKRMAYRDCLSTFKYLGDRKGFEGKDGSVLPQDTYAETIVKEV